MTFRKAFLYAFLFLIHTSIGFALPEDTFKTKKDCAFCHKAKKGGGPLNDAGLYYQKHGNLVGYQPQNEIKKAQAKKAREKIKQAQKKKKKGKKKGFAKCHKSSLTFSKSISLQFFDSSASESRYFS